jgi:hypothetical protein
MLAFIKVSMQNAQLRNCWNWEGKWCNLQKNVKYDYYKNGQYLVSVVHIGNIQSEIPFATDMQGEYAKDRFPSSESLCYSLQLMESSLGNMPQRH